MIEATREVKIYAFFNITFDFETVSSVKVIKSKMYSSVYFRNSRCSVYFPSAVYTWRWGWHVYDQVFNQVDYTALTQKDKHISVKIGISPYMPFCFINEKEHQKSTTFSFALHLFILTVVREDDSINSYSFTRTFLQSFLWTR
jgi:hypothetical protein